MSNNPAFRAGYVAIVGRPNVGKSTLLNHLVGQKISITSKKAQTTRHRIHGIFTDAESQFVFVDTPGFQTSHVNALNRALNRAVTENLQDVDAVMFVVEALHFDSRDRQVLALLPANRPAVLVITKIDWLEDRTELLPFIEAMAREFRFAEIVPVSAERSVQLEELIRAIRPLLPEGPPLYSADEVTDRSERFLAAEFLREKIFRLLGEELPYSTGVVIDEFKMEGRLRRIHASIIVDKPGQKAIIIGAGGKKLKIVATQARQDMEKLFGGKVFLEVWVKVKSGWADDARMVKTLGYG